MTRHKALSKEARLTTARSMLVVAMGELAAYGVAIHAPTLSLGGASCAKPNDEDVLEKKEQRLLKRKLPS